MKIKVGVCIPSARDCKTDFMRCISMAIAAFGNVGFNNQGVGIQLLTARDSLLAALRNTLAEQALQHDCTHVLFVDDDMQFPMDTISRLLKHNVDIVGVNAVAKVYPPHPTAAKSPGVRLMTKKSSKGLEKVYVCGTGVMLIKCDVFRKLPKPWFVQGVKYEKLKEALESPTREKIWASITGSDGEDSWFCKHAQEHGFEIFVDHDLSKSIKHIGDFDYTLDLMEEYHEMESADGSLC